MQIVLITYTDQGYLYKNKTLKGLRHILFLILFICFELFMNPLIKES